MSSPHQPASGGAEQPDPAAEAVFGRPDGVEGAFDMAAARRDGHDVRPASDARITTAEPSESLAEAFSPTGEDAGIVLQRPPEDSIGRQESNGTAAALWSAPADPWRDPGAGAMLGGPAVSPERENDSGEPQVTGAQLSLSEIIIGRRVTTTALVVLALIATVIGAAGGVIGWYVAQAGNQLTGEVTVSEAQAAKERPPGSVADIAQRVSPAVVSIEVVSGRSGGVGSGVIIDAEGYIITNHHVVSAAAGEGDAEVTVVFSDGSRAQAQVVGTDPKTDLAVLKVNVRNPTVIQIGKSADLAAGDSVIAVGSPFGLENTVTVGIVSALNRPVTAPGENGDPPVTYDAIQTDAAINPGNSGGALVDSTGALVGINSLIRTVGNAEGPGGSIGLGFAIPIDQAIRISESLIADGAVTHAALNVTAASVSASTSEGAQIQDVARDGAAAAAGIREGDVIVQVADRVVRNAAELTVAVRQHEPGDEVDVKLVRGGREFVVSVTLGSD